MRSMLIGCALLVFGSCAALAQQDPTPAQGGSPNAPAPAVATTPAHAAPGGGMASAGMRKPMMHGGMMMHHKSMMMHHRTMMTHHRRMSNYGMMKHHRHMMQHHRMMMRKKMM